jgi:hypothetical protein
LGFVLILLGIFGGSSKKEVKKGEIVATSLQSVSLLILGAYKINNNYFYFTLVLLKFASVRVANSAIINFKYSTCCVGISSSVLAM